MARMLAALAIAAALVLPAGGSATTKTAPTNTSEPKISGKPIEGRTLTGSRGTWSGTTPITYAYRWLRCDANATNCGEIPDATNSSYRLGSADVAKRVRVRITASNADGSVTATSNATNTVRSATVQAAPINTSEPKISGTPIEGRTLTASRGTWSGTTPISYKLQWLRCDANATNCADIPEATNSTYGLGSGDVGKRLRVRVTATNASGSASATSNATSTVTAAAQTGPPKNTKPPAITGTAAANEIVHVTTGEWTGAQPITYSFQWLRCDTSGNNCVTLPAASDDAYTIRDGDIGRTLRVRVTARNDQGSVSVLSPPSAVVQAAAGPQGSVKLPNGEVSIPVTSVPTNARLVIDRVEFSPNVVRSRAQPIVIRIKVKDTRGFVVRDALVFLRSTPVVTTTPSVSRTGTDGWVTYTVQPERDFPIRHGYSVQFFVKAYRQGDPPLAGVAAYRLVQVRTEP